jgi:hypothetical protein
VEPIGFILKLLTVKEDNCYKIFHHLCIKKTGCSYVVKQGLRLFSSKPESKVGEEIMETLNGS